MIIVCEGKEMGEFIDRCQKLVEKNACENCVMQHVCKDKGGIEFRLRARKSNE